MAKQSKVTPLRQNAANFFTKTFLTVGCRYVGCIILPVFFVHLTPSFWPNHQNAPTPQAVLAELVFTRHATGVTDYDYSQSHPGLMCQRGHDLSDSFML